LAKAICIETTKRLCIKHVIQTDINEKHYVYVHKYITYIGTHLGYLGEQEVGGAPDIGYSPFDDAASSSQGPVKRKRESLIKQFEHITYKEVDFDQKTRFEELLVKVSFNKIIIDKGLTCFTGNQSETDILAQGSPGQCPVLAGHDCEYCADRSLLSPRGHCRRGGCSIKQHQLSQ